jgi:maleylacetoacetate isomerase
MLSTIHRSAITDRDGGHHSVGSCQSSYSARLRIALHLKAIEHKPVYVNLDNGENRQDEYGTKNPSRSVPTLMVDDSWCIPQSMAALEYLEEAYPHSTSLLPTDAKSRADVRTLTYIITIDTQSLTNDTLIERAESSGADPREWLKFFTERGLKAFETVVSKTAGRYCCGDTITLADVCLMPALWNAEKHGVDLASFPTISRVYAALKDHPSFTKSHWRNQPDCPEELR